MERFFSLREFVKVRAKIGSRWGDPRGISSGSDSNALCRDLVRACCELRFAEDHTCKSVVSGFAVSDPVWRSQDKIIPVRLSAS